VEHGMKIIVDENALELLTELSQTRVSAGQGGAAATMKMARL
jgi:hypothetical protein